MTYGIPHTVRGWDPTDIVTTVDIDEYDLSTPEGFTAVILSGTESGPVILVPTVALTPVDTTPAEPESGAWLIGGQPFIREANCDGVREWLGGGFHVRTWKEVWRVAGGSGITPRRLVPERKPVDVSLPWRGISLRGESIELSLDPLSYQGVPVLRLTVEGESVVAVGPDTAERLGHGLIAAACAAREVEP